jgi:hypothetical protein
MSGDEEAKKHVDTLAKHAMQVAEGLIPVNSPPTFLRPEGDNVLNERGLPWLMPAEYPTERALEEFYKWP